MGGVCNREVGVSITELRLGNYQHSHPKRKQKRLERDALRQVSSSRNVNPKVGGAVRKKGAECGEKHASLKKGLARGYQGEALWH